MTFIEEVEQELRNVIGPAKSKAKVNMNTNNTNVTFIIFMSFLLIIGGAAVWYVKEGQKALPTPQYQNQYQNPNYYPQLNQPNYPQPSNDLNQKVDALIRQYQLLSQNTQKIFERGQWTQDRMRLMGTINNHNLAVIQGNLPRNELIYLNEDWTIVRMPDRIYLDAETQEFLRKFIRARAATPEQNKS